MIVQILKALEDRLVMKCSIQHTYEICEKFCTIYFIKRRNNLFFNLKANNVEKLTFGNLVVSFKDILYCLIRLERVFTKYLNKNAKQDAVALQLKNEFAKIYFSHPCEVFPISYFI